MINEAHSLGVRMKERCFNFTHAHGIVFDNGQRIICNNYACIAGIRYPKKGICIDDEIKDETKPKIIVVLLNSKQNSNNKEATIHYIDWLCNRSIFKDGIISKDPKEILEKGYMFFDANINLYIVCGGIRAIRLLWEYDYKINIFHTFSNAGLSEFISYVLSHFNYIENGYVIKSRFLTHSNIDSFANFERVLYLDKYSMDLDKNKSTYSENHDYAGIDEYLWGHDSPFFEENVCKIFGETDKIEALSSRFRKVYSKTFPVVDRLKLNLFVTRMKELIKKEGKYL